jgi:hypothetical protein
MRIGGREHQRRVLQRGDARPRVTTTRHARLRLSQAHRPAARHRLARPPAPASCSLPRTSASAARTSSSLSRCRRSCDCVPWRYRPTLARAARRRWTARWRESGRRAAADRLRAHCTRSPARLPHRRLAGACPRLRAPGRSLTCDHGRGDARARRAAVGARTPVPRPTRRRGRAPRRRHRPTDRPAGTHPAACSRCRSRGSSRPGWANRPRQTTPAAIAVTAGQPRDGRRAA